MENLILAGVLQLPKTDGWPGQAGYPRAMPRSKARQAGTEAPLAQTGRLVTTNHKQP